jgi:hypothetical protein
MQLRFIRNTRRALLFCADVRYVAAKKLMVTKYNTKGTGTDESHLILEDGNVLPGTRLRFTKGSTS